jgi:hypothetical protein
MRYEILMTAKMWMLLFLVMMSCGLKNSYQCSSETSPPTSLHGTITQKNNINSTTMNEILNSIKTKASFKNIRIFEVGICYADKKFAKTESGLTFILSGI